MTFSLERPGGATLHGAARSFPKVLPSRLHLQFYASQFGSTELNGVFYRTPTEEAVRTWAEQTPEDFVFAWKASKFITHWKRLNQTSVNSIALLKLVAAARRKSWASPVSVAAAIPERSQQDRRISQAPPFAPALRLRISPSQLVQDDSLTSCETTALHSVFQIITMLHRRGLPRLVSFM